MNAHADDSCPEPAILGAFVEGTLAPERVAIVTHHVSTCAKCRFIVESACEVEQDLDDPRPALPAAARFRWFPAAAAVAALAIVGIFVMRNQEASPEPDPIARLVAASPSSVRTIEPRVSGGFPWAPLRPLRRRSSAEKSPEELVASGAAGTVLRELEGNRTPKALHAAGVAYLVAGDARAAASLLEDAARGAEGNARVWNDLSAALYASARPEDREELTRALEASGRAIRLNPDLVEAYFNRALILERVGTREQVSAAWKQYLQRDPAGGWSAEARMRLANVVP